MESTLQTADKEKESVCAYSINNINKQLEKLNVNKTNKSTLCKHLKRTLIGINKNCQAVSELSVLHYSRFYSASR